MQGTVDCSMVPCRPFQENAFWAYANSRGPDHPCSVMRTFAVCMYTDTVVENMIKDPYDTVLMCRMILICVCCVCPDTYLHDVAYILYS